MLRLNTTAFICLTALTLSIAACGKDSTTTQASTEPGSPAWVLTAVPAAAITVTQAKATAKEGDQVILRGRIGGRKDPITEGSSVFTIMDLALPHCGDNPTDTCRTPWDYCCETPETIAENAATIQLLDADGNPISESLTALGFAGLDEVTVVGIVGPRPNSQVLTILATGIHRVGD